MPRKKLIFLSERNQKALDEFIIHIKATRTKNKNSLDNYKHSIQRVLNIAKKDYNKLTIKDLDRVFSKINGVTCELIKTKFRIFLRYYKMNELADSIGINFKMFSKSNKTDEDILTPDEIKTLINTPLELRDRAIIELFLCSGGERIAIANLKMGNIRSDSVTTWVTINHGKDSHEKRKHRVIPLVKDSKIPSTQYQKNLIAWIESHPFKGQNDKPLFFSKSSNNKGGFLHPGTINNIITKVCDDSGISKKITPHILRHTAATYDGAYLNEAQMCLKYGWVKGSDMPQRYCHQNENHLNEFLKKNAGLTDDIIERESICPNCQEQNNINAQRCKKCNYILDRELLNRTIEEKEKRFELLENQLKEYENRMNTIERVLTRNIQDSISPFHGITLTPEENEIEDNIEDEEIQKSYERLQKEIDDGKHKGYKITMALGKPLLVKDKKFPKNKNKTELERQFELGNLISFISSMNSKQQKEFLKRNIDILGFKDREQEIIRGLEIINKVKEGKTLSVSELSKKFRKEQ